MSIGRTYEIETLERRLVVIEGSFAPNSSSAVASSSNRGYKFSVARTSQGLFTLTFEDDFPGYRSFTATLQLATAAARFAQIGAYDADNKTLQIRIIDAAGAVQDVDANDNNRVNFKVAFSLVED